MTEVVVPSVTGLRSNDTADIGTKTLRHAGPPGERLVVNLVDELADREPNRIWATVTKSQHDIQPGGFRDVSFAELGGAVNRASWALHELFGGKSESFEVVAYLGLSDVRYAIYMFAAIKTGRQLMIPSVRNSVPQHLSVFDAASCSKVLYTAEMKPRIQQLVVERPGLQAVEVPDLDTLVSSIGCPHYQYTRSWPEARTDPILIAHSSGSTGNPKPTTITNGVYSTYDNHRKIPVIPGRKTQGYELLDLDGGRFFNPFPPFHLAGLFAMTIMPVFYHCTVTLGPPEKPPSGQLLSQAMRELKGTIRAAWCPPSVIEQLVLEVDGGFNQAASDLRWIMYTGGPLSPAVGDRLSKVTDVCQMYGSTETGPHSALVPLPENWAYFEWHPHLENEMDDLGDGTFEMVVHKGDGSQDWVRHLSQAYPDLEVWRTNDLFAQNPDNPRLWKFVGRRDDVIVLSNGEKFNPVTMEGIITGHALVKGAIILGTGRFQAALLVEPIDEAMDEEDQAFIDQIWPSIVEANAAGPAHGRIFRSKIAVARKDKPFLRAGKGTVIRGMTGKAYCEELNSLYQEDTEAAPLKLDDPKSLTSVADFVRACVEPVMGPSQTLQNTDDLFVMGVDSLQTLEIVKSLRRGFPSTERWISAASIYQNPTVQKYAEYMFRQMNQDKQTGSEKNAAALPSGGERAGIMAEMVAKYTADLNERSGSHASIGEGNSQGNPTPRCIAITGSTGSLGSYLVETFLEDESVSSVICLDRRAQAENHHRDVLASRHGHTGRRLLLDSLERKARFLQVDLGDAHLGLDDVTYTELVAQVDILVHNAWMVNFNFPLAAFEDVHVRGVRNLIDLCLSSTPSSPAHLFFVSSLSSVGNWTNCAASSSLSMPPVPETPLADYNTALPMGYGESKHVAERMLTAAIERTGGRLRASILRVGQVAGPTLPSILDEMAENEGDHVPGGEWHRTEWFPSLIRTSKTIGALPDSLNAIDWVPVDWLARAARDITYHDYRHGTSHVFNVANPHEADWSADLVPAIQEYYRTIREIKVVPWSEWLDMVRDAASGPKAIDIEEVPAVKILDFYEGLAKEASLSRSDRIVYSTEKSVECSKTMAALRAMSRQDMMKWLDQWGF